MAQAALTELLTINGIANYLTPSGPYHPVVDEVRDENYLRDFRKWITQQTLPPSAQELRDVKESVESTMRKAQEDVFLKHLDPKGLYKSVGKSILGDAIGYFIPVTGTVMTAVEEARKRAVTKDMRWQGFVIGARRRASEFAP